MLPSILTAALAALLNKAVPAGLRWIVSRFLASVEKYIAETPTAQAELDDIARRARGGPGLVGDAPQMLKDWLRTVLAAVADKIERPLLRRAYELLSGFVVDKLADMLWDKLFPAAETGLVGAAVPLHWNDEGALQQSLLAIQSDGRGTFTEAAQFPAAPEPAEDTVPPPDEGAEGTGPELVFDTPPVQAVAPVEQVVPPVAPEAPVAPAVAPVVPPAEVPPAAP